MSTCDYIIYLGIQRSDDDGNTVILQLSLIYTYTRAYVLLLTAVLFPRMQANLRWPYLYIYIVRYTYDTDCAVVVRDKYYIIFIHNNMLHYYNIIIRVVFHTYTMKRDFSSHRAEKINENYARITGGGGVLAICHGKPTRKLHRQLQPFTRRLRLQKRRIKERSRIIMYVIMKWR